MHDVGGQGCKSVATDKLVEGVNSVIRENRWFTMDDLSMKFPKVSSSSLYLILTEKLDSKQLNARRVPTHLTNDHKTP